jgi:hypothetical protein
MRGWQLVGYALVVGVCGLAFGAPPSYDHVVVVIEENHSLAQVIGSSSAPYINSLAANGSSFTNMFAITHPSQPNYLHFFSGASQGVTGDGVPSTFPFGAGSSNLGGALLNARKTFTGYSESMPYEGFNDATFTTVANQNQYVRKHNPWVNWQSDSPTGFQLPQSTNQPFTSFPTDFSTLPNLSIVVPNEQNDMHDGSVAQGDAWLQTNLGAYATWAKANNSLLIVTFDEDESASRNRIPTVFYGANVQTGQNTATWTLHNLLRTIEDTYGTTHSGAAAKVRPIIGSFTTDAPTVIRGFQKGVGGYASAKDTYIDATAGSTNFNHGGAGDVLVDGDPNQQGLIRFENIVGNGATQVASGTKVFSAKLRIYTGATSNDESPNTFGLYTMLRTWEESDTYDSLVGGISGSEVDATPSFSIRPNDQDAYVVFDVTDTVQAWVDGTLPNFGWMLKNDTGINGWRFISSDNGTADKRPYLEIVVPEPGGGLAIPLGFAYFARRPTRVYRQRA